MLAAATLTLVFSSYLFEEAALQSSAECEGCRKDLFAGRFLSCNGYYEGSTESGCDWVGGQGHCTFPEEKTVTAEQCRARCDADLHCGSYKTYFNSLCTLYYMDKCKLVDQGNYAVGNVYRKAYKKLAPPTTTKECQGCRKDLFAGKFIYCNGSYKRSTVSHCNWVGGPGDCSFPPEKSVTLVQCRKKCDADPRCRAFKSYYNTICNLYYMKKCTLVEQSNRASGRLFGKL